MHAVSRLFGTSVRRALASPALPRVAAASFRRALASPALPKMAAVATGGAVCTAAWTLAQAPASCEAVPAKPNATTFLTANFIADAAATASPALVNIRVGGEGMMQQQSSGSGFVVDASGLILTNTHVVRDAMRSGSPVTVTLSDGVTVLRGVVQHADSLSDIAIVRVRPSRPLATAKLGTSASLRPGEFVVALGAPAGLSNSVSAGIVSAVARTRSELGLGRGGTRAASMEYIQTDAAINSGNSGGPLLNLQGEVIGINTMKAMGTDGIAFALPIDDVKRVVDQLQRHGRVLRPYLGLKFVELDATIGAELRKQAGGAWAGGGGWGGGGAAAAAAGAPDAGLYVMHVTPDSPAQRAGVRVGDTLVGVDAAPLRTTKELLDGLSDRIGRPVQLEVQRGDKRVSVRCQVESMQQ